MFPTIITAAADGTVASAMSDVSDSNDFNYQGMSASITNKISRPVEEGAGMAKQVWNGFIDDILGPKARTS